MTPPAFMLRRTLRPSTAVRGWRCASSSRKPADPSLPMRQKFRRIAITGAIALITAVGAVTGARLGIDKDAIKQREKVVQLPIAERIAMLDARRVELVRAKEALERKISRLDERMRGDAATKEDGGQRD